MDACALAFPAPSAAIRLCKRRYWLRLMPSRLSEPTRRKARRPRSASVDARFRDPFIGLPLFPFPASVVIGELSGRNQPPHHIFQCFPPRFLPVHLVLELRQLPGSRKPRERRQVETLDDLAVG